MAESQTRFFHRKIHDYMVLFIPSRCVQNVPRDTVMTSGALCIPPGYSHDKHFLFYLGSVNGFIRSGLQSFCII
jgi:hypothetical protein